ncbi:Josephin-1 [Borealophlyctis nickersoniae]|nr:Josephin-1 [Borealophlyctis nickersoniae]
MSTVYHENQRLQLCAQHTLNNLLQRPAFTQLDLDRISTELAALGTNASILNPHRSPFGLGDYDVNVIMKALEEVGMDVEWFDRRKDVRDIDLSSLDGIIVNVFSTRILFWKSNHWFAIKKVPPEGDTFYNLDSKLSHPKAFASTDELLTFLTELLETREGQIFLVRKSEGEKAAGSDKGEGNEAGRAETGREYDGSGGKGGSAVD